MHLLNTKSRTTWGAKLPGGSQGAGATIPAEASEAHGTRQRSTTRPHKHIILPLLHTIVSIWCFSAALGVMPASQNSLRGVEVTDDEQRLDFTELRASNHVTLTT